jgi:hypothetical protein
MQFGRLNTIAQSELRYSSTKDLLREFGKIIAPNKVGKALREFDKEMEGKPLRDAGAVFLACLDGEYPFDLFVSQKKESLIRLLKGDFINSEFMQEAFSCFAEAQQDGEYGLVLFRMKLLGPFVAHNIPQHSTPTPRIVIPAKKFGVSEITIQSLKNFQKEINLE